MEQFQFRKTDKFYGCCHVEVRGDGPPYAVEARDWVYPKERTIFNGTEAEWERDVVAALGLVYRKIDVETPIRQEVVDAFNAWRFAENARAVEEVRSDPSKWGVTSNDHPLLSHPPTVMRGAHYQIGTGWVVNNPEELLNSIETVP